MTKKAKKQSPKIEFVIENLGSDRPFVEFRKGYIIVINKDHKDAAVLLRDRKK